LKKELGDQYEKLAEAAERIDTVLAKIKENPPPLGELLKLLRTEYLNLRDLQVALPGKALMHFVNMETIGVQDGDETKFLDDVTQGQSSVGVGAFLLGLASFRQGGYRSVIMANSEDWDTLRSGVKMKAP
jgi:hypothetical protein